MQKTATHKHHQKNNSVWYRIPVVWVCLICGLGSLAVCVITVIIALQTGEALQETGPSSRFQLTPDENVPTETSKGSSLD
ncbi:MAG: hypothetical protein ACK5ME_02425 [Parahaliea sp.]